MGERVENKLWLNPPKVQKSFVVLQALDPLVYKYIKKDYKN